MATNTFSYRVKREERRRFVDRAAYVASRCGVEMDATPRFCQVLEATVDPDRVRDGRPASGWKEFPWLTLVLGSGCLDLPDNAMLDPYTLADAVARSVPERLDFTHAAEDDELTRAFALNLILDRTGVERDERRANQPPEPSGQKVHPIAARLVLVAGMLSRFYFLASAESHKALSRWSSDEVQFDPMRNRGQSAAPNIDLMTLVIDPTLALMMRLRRDLQNEIDPASSASSRLVPGDVPALKEHPLVLTQVIKLLEQVGTNLRGEAPEDVRRLSLYHLRMITDVAWHFLSSTRAVYPGWSDLLVDLMLNERSNDFRRTRPRFYDLTLLGEAVSILLQTPTETSWERERDTTGEDLSPRDKFYEGVAHVLWAQADAVAATDSSEAFKNSKLPPSSAFVTSFDLEVEMALWRFGGGRPFSVAVPVHLLPSPDETGEVESPGQKDEVDSSDRTDEAESSDQKDEVEAEPCWLLATLEPRTHDDPKAELEALRTPTSWRLLTPDLDAQTFRPTPVVVHISGCPLLALPDLSPDNPAVKQLRKDLAEAGVSVDSTTLEHAVTVDEYLALRQAEAELFWSSSESSDSKDRKSRALHPTLTGSEGGEQNPRFWMAVGVPVADAAVRHRVVSQITLRGALASAKGTVIAPVINEPHSVSGLPPRPDASGAGNSKQPRPRRSSINGVAVNRRVNDDEASLLYWVGLDVVETDCRVFTDDLIHYASHVRADGAAKRPRPKVQCTLADGPTARLAEEANP